MNAGDMPKPSAPVRVPSESDPDVIAARRKKMLDEMQQRDGRRSTSLADNSAQAYSRTTLG
jgi:hypothetical protein